MKDCHSDSVAIVDALIAAGASLSAVNAAGTTPLHWSVHSDSDALITAVVHRLCPQLADSQRSPPTPTSQSTSVAQLPVCGALTARNERNETALHWAVDWQKPVAVSTLLRLADGSSSSGGTTAARQLVDATDVHGDTPLHRLPIDCPSSAACRLIAQQLIARGANVTAENAAHRTPLAHFPTPTQPQQQQQREEGEGTEREEAAAELGERRRDDDLDEQAEQFRRNLTQQFNTLR